MVRTHLKNSNTWLNYIGALKTGEKEKEQFQLTGFEHFFKTNSFTHSFFRHSIPFFYLLDYKSGMYTNMSENFAGYKSESFLKYGISHMVEIYQPEHFRLFDQEIFPGRLNILKDIPPEEFRNYVFSYNLMIKNRSGVYENFLQRNCFSADPSGKPVFSMGMLININHHQYDKRVIQTIDRIDVNGDGENQTVLKDVFYLNEEDKLFSKREKEILSWIAEGLSSKMIAGKLHISENTVVNHRRSMQDKSNTPNTAALISFAIRSCII